MKKIMAVLIALSWIWCQLNARTVEAPNLEVSEKALESQEERPLKIQKMEDILLFLDGADANTVVIFDVDEVLISTVDLFLHPECDDVFLGLVAKAFANAGTDKEREELEKCLSLSMLLPRRVLVEETTPALIRCLQDKGVKTIALTSCPTGRFGVIPQVEKWRITQLKSLGIDFSRESPFKNNFQLEEILKKNYPTPLFENGILFSKGYSKGEVLVAFLNRINWRPSKIIFIDDLEENLLSVKEHLEGVGIPFVGFHYLGASISQEKIDADLIQYQFDYLLQHGQWLSDEEVKKMKNTVSDPVKGYSAYY